MNTLWYNGPIEEYQVRDCTTGYDETFFSYDAAENKYMEWSKSRQGHQIMLIAMITSI
jgi:hypothetical protein